MSSQLGSFEKILRVGEGRRMKRLAEQAAYITSIEPEFSELSDDELEAAAGGWTGDPTSGPSTGGTSGGTTGGTTSGGSSSTP